MKTKFVWYDDCEKSFQELKSRLVMSQCYQSSHVLEVMLFILILLCIKGLVMCICRMEKLQLMLLDNKNPYEIKYPTHDLKLAEVTFALKIWRNHLYVEKCEIYTNHKSLKYFLSKKELDMRQKCGLDSSRILIVLFCIILVRQMQQQML